MMHRLRCGVTWKGDRTMIYFVEDDSSIRELVVYTLENMGLEVQGFGKPTEFWQAMQGQLPELILLDIMLPEEDGLSILRKLRENGTTKRLPVMMLTAKDTEYDAVLSLDSGADDYVQKPFRMMELLSRVKALLRRTEERGKKLSEFHLAELYVFPGRHLVQVSGQTITLTLKEFELLCLLLENMDIVLTRDQLLSHIWGGGAAKESRTVDVHVRTLRQKLGSAGRLIETVRGIGYKLASPKAE